MQDLKELSLRIFGQVCEEDMTDSAVTRVSSDSDDSICMSIELFFE